MATAVVMPKQGQSVESCIIVGWKKAKGDPVSEGETLCEVETDKALLEVESPASGTLLAQFFSEGDEVPVLTNIAVIGEPGEAVDDFRPEGSGTTTAPAAPQPEPAAAPPAQTAPPHPQPASFVGISPRARNLAERKEVDITKLQLQGSGPGGRIIERDIEAALAQLPKMTPLAKTMVAQGDYTPPPRGSGAGGRVRAEDLQAVTGRPTPAAVEAEAVETVPVKGVRKVIAQRMLESLQTTAQLTLNASADARAMLAYRRQLKNSAELLGLQNVTINDLILFTVSRILPQHPQLNAHFLGDSIARHKNIHLGMAVDTPRGLMVPVIKQANRLSLKQMAEESKRLATACLERTAKPDELTGGTFTVTNLGSFGIESFTPVLNPPEVAILGVGNINLKPVELEGEVQFLPHLGLSLTINHQAVDGAPAARFLQTVAQGLAQLQMLLAL